MITDWLLTLVVAGRMLRYAGSPRVVLGDVYRPGLDVGQLALSEGADTVDVTVFDPLLHSLADALDAGTGTLAFLEGDEVIVYTTGPITNPGSGAPDEPITITLAREIPGTSLGTEVPDITARVDATTWPVTALHEIGSEGLSYPVIFGYPGYTGATNPEPVVPCPIAQWKSATTGTTYTVVSEDPAAIITSVRWRNQEALADFDQSVIIATDLLGQRVRVATCTTGGAPSVPSTAGATILVGYKPSGGGGVARGLYDVIAYLLRRWGPDSVDWARLQTIRPVFEPYSVDSYVDQPVPDPWTLISHFIEELPVEVRVGPKGRYLIERRYTHDPARLVGRLDVESDATRQSPYARDGAPINEITVDYRSNPESGWMATIVATGSIREVQPAGVELGNSVIETALARRSFARYGRRPGPRIALDWTWDTNTARAVGDAALQRTALPATLVDYLVRPDVARGLREGDELLVTDPDRPWVEVPGIIDGPPVRSLEAVLLSLRVPQE